jgi:signal transduction histidine kinase
VEPPAPTDDLLLLALELAGSLDARTVMRRILERSLAVASADRATLSSIAGDRLRIEASVGSGGEITWVGRAYANEALVRQPLVQQLLDTKQTVLGGPMATAEALPEFREALDKVLHTATVPILEEHELVGMLVVSRYGDRAFEPADVPSLTAFGALAGLALRNAKLYEEATAAARRLQAAADAAADVAALPVLPALLKRIIEHACTAAGADSAAVMRLEAGEGIVEATSGVAPVGSRWPLGPEIEAAVRSGRPIQVATSDQDIESHLEQYASPYSHALVEPLQFAGDLLGILVLGRFHERQEFSEEDIATLRQFATLAAVVLHNGRLVHRLRETEKMKREFMDIAVHELRGPLTVIEGYTELLIRDEAGKLDPEGERQLATIRRQAGHARTLAEDLLVLARIESDDLGVAHDTISVADAIGAAIERAQPRARLRAGTIEAKDVASARAIGDAGLLARILDNLLSNAIAYAIERPRITVTTSADPACIYVRVQDNGPGVIEDERERIFARFARGTHIGGTKGSGLGLHLSRECARRMGGDLVLEDSRARSGSRFLLTMPAA